MENDTICRFYETTVVTKDPSAVGNSTVNYNSADNADLSTEFTFLAGLNQGACNYTTGSYKITGINQLIKTMDGTYVLTVSNLKGTAPAGTMVLRGNPTPNFGDPNYYGHDYGTDHVKDPGSYDVGCAGIYATILNVNGTPTLKFNVRGMDADGYPVLHVYTVAMTGYDIKIVDDNTAVKFYEGDTLLATVALTGNASGYATQAVVTLADGTTETLDDVCAAATAASDIGFIARSADLTFDAVTLTGLPEAE